MAEQTQVKNNSPVTAAPARNTEAPASEGININLQYFVSLSGIFKVIEWILAIICIACGAPGQFGGAHFFLLVVVVFFIGTFVWMCIHFFNLSSLLNSFPWALVEFSYTVVACLLYFVAAVTLLVQTCETQKLSILYLYGGPSRWDAYIAAGCFGLFNCVVFGVESYFLFKSWRESKRVDN